MRARDDQVALKCMKKLGEFSYKQIIGFTFWWNMKVKVLPAIMITRNTLHLYTVL